MRRRGVIAVIFGPPGSGKGTQASYIEATFDLTHVSTGDMLRNEVARGTPLGEEVEPIMESGDLVSDDLIVRVLEARLALEEGHQGILLDGFPRTEAQAAALDEALSRRGGQIGLVLVLEVPEPELIRRIIGRSQAEGRLDDSPETVANRLEVYRTETAPVLDYYDGRSVDVRRIDGVGDVEEVRARIRDAFETLAEDTVAP